MNCTMMREIDQLDKEYVNYSIPDLLDPIVVKQYRPYNGIRSMKVHLD
jgi:hypothetical protein